MNRILFVFLAFVSVLAAVINTSRMTSTGILGEVGLIILFSGLFVYSAYWALKGNKLFTEYFFLINAFTIALAIHGFKLWHLLI